MADAVLYEGYVLYPYRASSRKNQARFQWGVLTPRAFSEAEGSERWAMRTECLIAPGPSPAVSVRVRCLRAQRRRIEGARQGGFEAVDHLDVDGTRHVDWDEAVEETVDVSPLPLLPGGPFGWVKTFSFDGGREFEELRAADGTVVGRFVRHREPVSGLVRIAISRPDPESSYVKVAVTVENTTGWNRRGRAPGRGHAAQPDLGPHDAGRRRRALRLPARSARRCRPGGARLPERRGVPGPHRG